MPSRVWSYYTAVAKSEKIESIGGAVLSSSSTVKQCDIKVIELTKLIELKLASGSAPDRLKDLADVQELIRTLALKASLVEQLDESVREQYMQLWSAINRQ